MTDSEHAGHDREDGELEDGEIDDAGLEETQEQEAKEDEKQKNEKAYRKSRKKHKKEREKKKSKRRKREKHKHNSPSSDDSSDYSLDSDVEHTESSHKKRASFYRDYDIPFSQHGHLSGSYMTSKKSQHNKKFKKILCFKLLVCEKFKKYFIKHCDCFFYTIRHLSSPGILAFFKKNYLFQRESMSGRGAELPPLPGRSRFPEKRGAQHWA